WFLREVLLKSRSQRVIQLDRRDIGPPTEQLLGEDAETGSDLEHLVAWLQVRLVGDARHDLGIQQEVLSLGSRPSNPPGAHAPEPGFRIGWVGASHRQPQWFALDGWSREVDSAAVRDPADSPDRLAGSLKRRFELV